MKTIEEISKEISEQVFFNERHIDIISAIKDIAKRSIIEAQRWIPVSEQLPENKDHGFSELVLTKNKFNNIMLERYDFDSNCFNGIRYDAIEKGDGQVTHFRLIELK